jgi:cytochrome c-type biogenesis protein CcmH/NrfG
MDQHRPELAAAEFRNHLAQFPEDSAAHACLALCLLELKKFSDAEAEVRLATTLDPDSSFAHRTLAWVLLGRRRFSDALQSARESVALDPSDADSYAILARALLHSLEFDQALVAINKGLEADPNNVDCANVRAIILHASNRPNEARAEAERSLSLNPEDPHSHIVHGAILIDKGRAEEALIGFKEALRVNPENDAARQGLVAALRARSWFFGKLYRYKYWAENTTLAVKILIAIATLAVLYGIIYFIPALRFTAPLFIFGWFALMLLTWVADPVATLALRFNAYGRLALSRDEVRASNLAAAMIIPCFILLLLSFRGGDDFAGPAVTFFLLINPAYRIFSVEPGRPRRKMATAFIVLLLLAVGWSTFTIGRHLSPAFRDALPFEPDYLGGAFLVARVAHILVYLHCLRAPR